MAGSFSLLRLNKNYFFLFGQLSGKEVYYKWKLLCTFGIKATLLRPHPQWLCTYIQGGWVIMKLSTIILCKKTLGSCITWQFCVLWEHEYIMKNDKHQLMEAVLESSGKLLVVTELCVLLEKLMWWNHRISVRQPVRLSAVPPWVSNRLNPVTHNINLPATPLYRSMIP